MYLLTSHSLCSCGRDRTWSVFDPPNCTKSFLPVQYFAPNKTTTTHKIIGTHYCFHFLHIVQIRRPNTKPDPTPQKWREVDLTATHFSVLRLEIGSENYFSIHKINVIFLQNNIASILPLPILVPP